MRLGCLGIIIACRRARRFLGFCFGRVHDDMSGLFRPWMRLHELGSSVPRGIIDIRLRSVRIRGLGIDRRALALMNMERTYSLPRDSIFALTETTLSQRSMASHPFIRSHLNSYARLTARHPFPLPSRKTNLRWGVRSQSNDQPANKTKDKMNLRREKPKKTKPFLSRTPFPLDLANHI